MGLIACKDRKRNVPTFIKHARKKMEMTQEAFAEQFNCTKANVSGWENGLHEPSYRQLRKISDVSSTPLPHDKIGMLLDKLGVDVEHIDIDQIEILKESLTVPKENRIQVKRVISTFKDADDDSGQKGSIEQ